MQNNTQNEYLRVGITGPAPNKMETTNYKMKY